MNNLAENPQPSNPRRAFQVLPDTYNKIGTRHGWTFAEFGEQVRIGLAVGYPSKDAMANVVPGELGDLRNENGNLAHNANVRSISCVGIDYDNGSQAAFDAAIAKLAEDAFSSFWYDSPNNGRPDANGVPLVKKRVFIETDRSLAPHELNPVRDWLVTQLGITHDSNARNASRVWYVGKIEGTPDRAFGRIEGEPLPVDVVLKLAPAPAPSTRERTDRKQSGTETDGHDHTAVISLLTPYYTEHHKHAIAYGLAGYYANRGYTLADAERVIEALPSDNVDARLQDADDAFNATTPAGWSKLAEHLPAEALSRLEALIPDMRQPLIRVLPIEHTSGPQAAANDLASAFPVTTEQLNDGALCRAIDVTTVAGVASLLRRHTEWVGVIAYDAFACRVLVTREPPTREQDKPSASCLGDWTDAHTARARAWITEKCGDEPPGAATDQAVEIAARANAFHPVREYLSALNWDGTARLETLLVHYFGAAPSAYVSLIGSKFMLSAVARAFQPGCKVDTMLILEGAQGTFKSTAISTLASAAWFADTALDFDSKDAAQCLQGKWLYEIGELASFNRSEVSRIKAFISSPSDNMRPSYGRRNQDFPRQCVFVGTTNDEHYLTDTTGNRRYWPVKCGRVAVAALHADRDQLWAEAVARYRAGERWWLQGAEEGLAASEQAERESEDPWEASLRSWLQGQQRPSAPFSVSAALLACGLPASQQKPGDATRAGRLLAKLGYQSKRQRDPNNWKEYTRVYVPRAG